MQTVTGINGAVLQSVYSVLRQSTRRLAETNNEDGSLETALPYIDGVSPGGSLYHVAATSDSTTQNFRGNARGRQYARKVAHLNDKISVFLLLDQYLRALDTENTVPLPINSIRKELEEQAVLLIDQYQDPFAGQIMEFLKQADAAAGGSVEVRDFSVFQTQIQVELGRLHRLMSTNRQLYEEEFGKKEAVLEAELPQIAAEIGAAIQADQAEAFGGQANQDSLYVVGLLDMN